MDWMYTGVGNVVWEKPLVVAFRNKQIQSSHIHMNTGTYSLDFLLAVVTLISYTDCIDPRIGAERRNIACK